MSSTAGSSEWLRRPLLAKVASAVVEAAAHVAGGRWDAAAEMSGATLGTPTQAGRWLLVPVGAAELSVHLGPAGRLELSDGHEQLAERVVAPVRAVWLLRTSDGAAVTLVLRDPRGFSRLHWVADPAAAAVTAGPRGEDPRVDGFDSAAAASRLAGSPRAVRVLLVEGAAVTGVAGAAADEALWAAGVHPDARHLDAAEAAAVVAAVAEVCARRGAAASSFGADGDGCARCSATLTVELVGGRPSTVCPGCQPAPVMPARRATDRAGAVAAAG